MCCVPNETSKSIKAALSGLITKRKSFTGWEVYRALLVECQKGKIQVAPSHRDVTLHARELFNRNDEPFKGNNYASMIVCDEGPVLFFACPRYAKKKAKDIANALKQ